MNIRLLEIVFNTIHQPVRKLVLHVDKRSCVWRHVVLHCGCQWPVQTAIIPGLCAGVCVCVVLTGDTVV